jgi:hypothetical protein
LTSFFRLPLEVGPRAFYFRPDAVHRRVKPLARLFHLLPHAPGMLFERKLELLRGAFEGIMVHDSPRCAVLLL